MGNKNARQRANLKQFLFERDGWQDDSGKWWVTCAFGCGDVLGWHDVTIDHYPIMKQHGGTLSRANTRLACAPCNHMNRNKNGSNKSKAKLVRMTKRQERKKIKRKSSELRRTLAENYPSAEGRDVNGYIRMDFKI